MLMILTMYSWESWSKVPSWVCCQHALYQYFGDRRPRSLCADNVIINHNMKSIRGEVTINKLCCLFFIQNLVFHCIELPGQIGQHTANGLLEWTRVFLRFSALFAERHNSYCMVHIRCKHINAGWLLFFKLPNLVLSFQELSNCI